MLSVYIQGFGIGAGLIIAIGSQNAYVLRQGLKRDRVLLICLLCALSDAFLIALGVAGVGTLVARHEILVLIAQIGGALFLSAYALRAVKAAFKDEYLDLTKVSSRSSSLGATVLTTLAFTYLNPHVYLDTLVLIGGISGQFDPFPRVLFGLGAASASIVWFFALGYGARLLAPVFQKPQAWRILDLAVACVMFSIAVLLLKPVIL